MNALKKNQQECIKTKGFHLLLPAAGQSSRMGKGETAKPYLKLHGKSILRHTIEQFLTFENLRSIRVIIDPRHLNDYNQAVHDLKIEPYIEGSTSRKLSIYNGLNSFTKSQVEEVLLIHDAARPCVKTDDIIGLLNALDNEGTDGATLATPVSDTLYREGDKVSREDLWAIQTPQAFKISTVLATHQHFQDNDSFTDDASMVRAMGKNIAITPSSRENIKITTQEDLEMAEKLLKQETKTRTAMGFDVHAFETERTEKPLILGGITIPHDYALKGHSDADVVLHAITDALLGSINAGDIGTHFPPSDNQWKDADSAIFLHKTLKLLNEQGAAIEFIDVTILAEAPKIGPHRETLQNNIAKILSVSPDIISIKATTTEQLGFTGRKEGIACQAVATITL